MNKRVSGRQPEISIEVLAFAYGDWNFYVTFGFILTIVTPISTANGLYIYSTIIKSPFYDEAYMHSTFQHDLGLLSKGTEGTQGKV